MGQPQFTPEENQLLVWLSYQTVKSDAQGLSVTELVRSLAYGTKLRGSALPSAKNQQAADYLLLLESMPEKYGNLAGFSTSDSSNGNPSGFQGLALSDKTNSIVLNTGSDAPSVKSPDWQGHAKSLFSGKHQQQPETNEFYRHNKATDGGWTYVVGHSLGGGLTLALLVSLLNDGDLGNTFGYIENSADFNETAFLDLAQQLGMDPESNEFKRLKERLIDSGLQTGSSPGEVLSKVSHTDGGTILKGHFSGPGGHNRDHSFLVMDVDTGRARELQRRLNNAAALADSIHAAIEQIGPCILQDVRSTIENAVTPKNPLDLAIKAAQFPGRIGLLVAHILPSIVAGGGWLNMTAFLHIDFLSHLESRHLRAAGDYFGYVSQRVEECESARVREASKLSA